MFKRTRFLLVLLIALLTIPVTPKRAEAAQIAVLLPAGFWVIVGGIVYSTVMGWWIASTMDCGDCAFRGRGDGGSF